MRKNCSSDKAKLLKIRGQNVPIIFKNVEITGTINSIYSIYSKKERSEQFMKQNTFLTCC